jgi:hypothetical protein
MKSYRRSAVSVFITAVILFIAACSSKAGAIIGQLPRPAADGSAPAISQSVLDSGDNAWMLASCALVLMMTAPGLVRAKNVLAAMMHSLILVAPWIGSYPAW